MAMKPEHQPDPAPGEAGHNPSEALAVVGHELSNSLHGLLSTVHLLRSTSLDPEQREYVETLDYSARALFLLVDNLIALRDTQIITPGEEKFDLHRMVKSVVALLERKMRDKGLALAVSVPAELPRYVGGDAGRLGQILLNLLGNAVKYTERGRIEVTVSRPAPGRFRFVVSDTGIGTDEPPAQLFQPYYRGAEGIIGGYGGSGLGLSICKRLVDALGGDIGLESRRGVGTRAWFELPLREDPVTGGAAIAATILLVEDEATNRSVMGKLLRARGYQVEAVASGADALALLEQRSCDLALMDLNLPGMSGTETLTRMRASGRLLPALAYSADAREATVRRALEVGFAGFIAKPVTVEQVDGEIRRVLAGVAASHAVGADLIRARVQPLTDSVFLGQLREDLGSEAVAEAVRLFRGRSRQYIGGLQAACLERNGVEAAKLAHQLAGAAGVVGLMRLAQRSREASEQLADCMDGCDKVVASLVRVWNESLRALDELNLS